MARQVARRQQRERIAGVVVVCLGLVVLAVAVLALREPNGHVAASAGSSSSDVAARSRSGSSGDTTQPAQRGGDSHSPAALKAVPLVVLNNSYVHGLAAQASHQFEDGGWTVSTFGNYQNDIISSCAYYDRSDATARAAARALQQQFPGIKRVEPKFDGLPSGPVVVVLTGEYSVT